jgi:LacI family transcriptional regulator
MKSSDRSTPRDPIYVTLAAQVAAHIRAGIARAAWSKWLPGERALVKELQTSRKTLRKALTALASEGVLRPEHGRGHRIVRATAATERPGPLSERTVAILLPEPLETLRPFTALWVNQLKSALGGQGCRLRLHAGKKFYSRQPAAALGALVAQSPADAWLLTHSTAAMQRWFVARALPVAIAGTCHAGVSLPSVDLDHAALARHAAGRLLAAGHRHLALLTVRAERAGDLESEAGFRDGLRRFGATEVEAAVIHHEHDPADIARALRRLFEGANAPTAFFVSNGLHYLTVLSALAQRGLRVPQDVSVVSRDDDAFLHFVVPAPARYTCRADRFASRVSRMLFALVAHESPSPPGVRLMSTFIAGASIAAPRIKP